MKSLILFSGGIDSAVCALLTKREKKDIIGLTFDYSQRHKIEINKARKLGKIIGFEKHFFIKIPSTIFNSSSLVNKELKVPLNYLNKNKIPSTYVPSRNLIFLSIASALAESEGMDEIYIGANQVDFSGYPDCTLNFIKAFQNCLKWGTKRGIERKGIKIVAPLINKSKKEIIILGKKLGLDFSMTWSCYAPNGRKPCGKCDSCLIRKNAFKNARIEDPLYKN